MERPRGLNCGRLEAGLARRLDLVVAWSISPNLEPAGEPASKRMVLTRPGRYPTSQGSDLRPGVLAVKFF